MAQIFNKYAKKKKKLNIYFIKWVAEAQGFRRFGSQTRILSPEIDALFPNMPKRIWKLIIKNIVVAVYGVLINKERYVDILKCSDHSILGKTAQKVEHFVVVCFHENPALILPQLVIHYIIILLYNPIISWHILI